MGDHREPSRLGEAMFVIVLCLLGLLGGAVIASYVL